MNKISIIVPPKTKYLSLIWDDIKRQLPTGHIVFDKKVCGCGATEAYLRDTNQKTILASPRKQLLYNKYTQHLGECHLWHYDNEKQYFSNQKDTTARALHFKDYLSGYLRSGGSKILVTYDSLDKITDVLIDYGEDLNDWVVVVDEMQAIFYDAHYKPTTELEFTEAAQRYQSVVYLSATPYLEEYLNSLSLFKNLPFVELDWSNNVIAKNKVEMVKYTAIQDEFRKIIEDYRNGNGRTVLLGGQSFTSHEAVFYVNSVNMICKVIEANKLTPADTDVICSSSDERNRKKLGKLGFDISTIPGKAESRKMFTFCTSTVYLGADMYSDNAYSYIFGDPRISSMALDPACELIQILGRQRDERNPFKNTGTFYFSVKSSKITKEELEENIKQKSHKSQCKIENYRKAPHPEAMLDDIRNTVKVEQYKKDYCAIITGNDGKPTIGINELVIASEYRSWQIINDIYNDVYTLYGTVASNCDTTMTPNDDSPEVKAFYEEWNKDKVFARRMKLFCDTPPEVIEKCNFIPKRYYAYIDALGPEGLLTLEWREDYIKAAIEPSPFDPKPKTEIAQRLLSAIHEGDNLGRKQVKKLIQEIYDDLGIKQKATAEDIKAYMTVQRTDKGFRVDSLLRKNVSLSPKLAEPDKTETWDVDKLLNTIKTGKYFNLKTKIDAVRKQKTKEELDKKKSLLPLVCWNGEFSYRNSNKENLVCYSSFTALDFDKFATTHEMENFRKTLKSIPWVYAVFITPSGKGLKAIAVHDNLFPEYHADLYQKLMDELRIDEIDSHTKDLGRGNYMSYDPDLWINPCAAPYHYVADQGSLIHHVPQSYTVIEDKNEVIIQEDENDTARLLYEFCTNVISDESIMRILRKRWEMDDKEHDRNCKALTYLGILCKAGVPQVKAIPFVCSLFLETWSDKVNEITHASKWAYAHNKYGSERKKFNPHRR